MKKNRLMYISSIVTMLVLFSTTIAQDLSTVTRPRRVKDVNQQASLAPVQSELAMNTGAEPAPNLTTMVTGIRLPKKSAPEIRANATALSAPNPAVDKPTMDTAFIGDKQLKGKGKANAKITVSKKGDDKFKSKTANADKDGAFTVDLDVVTVKDETYLIIQTVDGVDSPAAEAKVEKPPKPKVDPIKADDVKVSGTALPKAVVKVFRKDSSNSSEDTAKDKTGLYIVGISPNAAKGETLRIQQQLEGASSDFTVITVGEKAPNLEAPFLNQVNVGDDSISGKTEGGLEVKYFRKSHTEPERTAKADSDGFFKIRGINPQIGKDDRAFITVTRDDQTISVDVVPVGRMDLTHANLIGIAPFGVVLSNQADRFSQSDPFGGFVIGYMGKARNRYLCRYVPKKDAIGTGAKARVSDEDKIVEDCVNWDYVKTERDFFGNCLKDGKIDPEKKEDCVEKFEFNKHLQIRIQGIFETDGRTAAAPAATTASDPNPPKEDQTFIASRKSFDLDFHMWGEYRAIFSKVLTWGPYVGVGGSFALSKNEVTGEGVNLDVGKGGTSVPLDTNKVRSSDSGKLYYEGGLALNLYSHDEADANLYVQAFMAFGHYEAFADLRPEANTKWRGVGKLRVFPFGLNRDFFEHGVVTPMFGVELNAGKGPDHVKFFIGSAFNISKFIEKIKGSTTGNN